MPIPEPHRPSLALVLVGALLLLWPMVLNLHPYLFWDSYGYFLQGRAYLAVIGAALGWAPVPAEAQAGWIGAAGRMLAHDASIRAPAYGALLYALAATGGFWLVAAAQATCAMATLEIVLARLAGLGRSTRLGLYLLLAAGSTLPWFVCFMMPDLFAGLLILALAALAQGWPRLRPWERGWLLLLVTLAASFHGSHLLLAAALVPVAACLAPTGRHLRVGARLAAPVLAAALLGLAAGWLAFGQPTPTPRAPPFLLARGWEDGPVRAYLDRACAQGADWTMCGLRDRLPPSAQEFLWAETGSYWAMTQEQRAAVRAEAAGLVLQAVMADPLGQLAASLRNAGRQLVRIGLGDLVVGRGALVTPEDYTFLYLPAVPAAVWGLDGFSTWCAILVLASLAVLAVAARRPRPAEMRPLAAPVLAGIVLNAAICGVLSGPFDRYQARVIWLLPLLAGAVLLAPRPGLSAASCAPGPGAT